MRSTLRTPRWERLSRMSEHGRDLRMIRRGVLRPRVPEPLLEPGGAGLDQPDLVSVDRGLHTVAQPELLQHL